MSLDEAIAEGFSAALETYQEKIVDLERDNEYLQTEIDTLEEENRYLADELEDVQGRYAAYLAKTDLFADSLRVMAGHLEDGLD